MQIAFQLTELFHIEIDTVISAYWPIYLLNWNMDQAKDGQEFTFLHDNASSHKCEVVKYFFGFWKGESLKPSTLFREAVLTSTHNLCFWAILRKIMYTPVNPSFTI